MVHLGSPLPDYAKSIIAYDIGKNNIQPILDNDVLDESILTKFDDLYHHLHTGDRTFELKCFQRWFVLRDYCLHNNINAVWHIDTDVVLFGNLQWYVNECHITTTMLSEPHSGMAISGAVSYWLLPDLIRFCEFLEFSYNNKVQELTEIYNKYRETKSYGGICDMILLKMFARSIPHGSLLMYNPKINAAFNDNVHNADNYYKNEYPVDQQSGSKIFKFQRGISHPVSNNLYYQLTTNWMNLHFCGGAKDSIEYFQKISIGMKHGSDLH